MMYSVMAPLSDSVMPASGSSMNGLLPVLLPGTFFRDSGARAGALVCLTSLYSSCSSSSSQVMRSDCEMPRWWRTSILIDGRFLVEYWDDNGQFLQEEIEQEALI